MAMRLFGLKARLWLIYLKHLKGERGQVSFNVSREICVFLADFLLPQVTSTFLRFFNTSAWEYGPPVLLSTPIQADNGSTWVVLEDGRLFCCGGGQGSVQAGLDLFWSAAYLLGRDGAVDELPRMLTARLAHGVIQVLRLYVFGGLGTL